MILASTSARACDKCPIEKGEGADPCVGQLCKGDAACPGEGRNAAEMEAKGQSSGQSGLSAETHGRLRTGLEREGGEQESSSVDTWIQERSFPAESCGVHSRAGTSSLKSPP